MFTVANCAMPFHTYFAHLLRSSVYVLLFFFTRENEIRYTLQDKGDSTNMGIETHPKWFETSSK